MRLAIRSTLAQAWNPVPSKLSARYDILPAAGSSRSLRTALSRLDRVHSFAPLAMMHSGERAFPMDPMNFVRICRFRHYRGVHNTAEQFSKLQGWIVSSSHGAEFYDIPVEVINRFIMHPDGKHRSPCDDGRGVQWNVYLGARGDLSGTRVPTGRIPTYYYILGRSNPCCAGRRADYAIQYWWFFGENPTPWNYHQGDWEHVTVVVKSGKAIGAYLGEHKVARYHSSAKLSQFAQRFVIYIARGSHAAYSTPGKKRTVGIITDSTDARGQHWNTWHRLQPLLAQPWKDFAGGWGDLSGRNPALPPCKEAGGSGPLGPLPQSRRGKC